MITKVSFLLVLMSILYSDAALQYYVSPDPIDNVTCTVSGNTTLRPCYSLQQLSEDETLLSNKTQLTLLLLSGTHVVPNNRTLTVSNVGEFEIHPWNEEQKVVIECQWQAGFIFKGIGELKIVSLNFTSCTLDYNKTNTNNYVDVINIANCVFAESEKNGAIIINNPYYLKISILITNCIFSSNNGGISCSTDGLVSYAPHQNNIALNITDTLFLNNWRDSDGGALYIYYVDLKLQRSQFISNTATSGGAIYSSRSDLNINKCWFKNNSALYSGGAIYGSRLTLNKTILQENFANRSGGAIYSSWSDLNIYKCWFKNNSVLDSGGAIYGSKLTLNDTIFQENFANSLGGAILLYSIGIVYNCQFKKNAAGEGGAIHSTSSTTRLTLDDIIFQENFATKLGGAILLNNIGIVYNCQFKKNAAGEGGAIHFTRHLTDSFELNNSTFQENIANISGGAVWFNSGMVHNCQFKKNSAGKGGAIYSEEFNLNNNTFKENFAKISGGAIYSKRNSYLEFTNDLIINCWFKNNSARMSGGALFLYKNIHTTILDFGMYITLHITNTSFKYNQASINGGAIYCGYSEPRCEVSIQNGLDVIGNDAANGGAIYAENVSFIITNNAADLGGALLFSSQIQVEPSNNVAINHNIASSNGGAIYAVNSSIILSLHALMTVDSNTAEDKGGALFLDNSHIKTDTQSRIIFNHNTVTSVDGKGGAIFVFDTKCHSSCECFLDTSLNSTLDFLENSATYGSVLYGGLLDRCLPRRKNVQLPSIDYFKQISNYERTPLAITSDPLKVCLCDNGTQPNCTTRELTSIEKMRGDTVKLLVTAVDQDENPVLSIIKAFYSEPLAELDIGEGRKTVKKECRNISYHIFTVESSATLILEPVGICKSSPLSSITIHIELINCSRGFELHNDRCICERRIAEFFNNNTVCHIDNQSIKRMGSIWLRYDEQYLMLHNNCPLDYCQTSSDTISLISPDEQCANHRSGTICGACQDNYSIALGGSKCLQCTSSYTFVWLTVVFAVAGVALVALLLVCNMTISTGTLNGLIFYANVVSISGLTSLQNCSIHSVLSVFIAWMNLDFGFETCFYSGMDTYQKTWLQFAFPLYIWLLVTTIIVASYYSSTAMKVFGRNNIAILATLFLLSYSKVLKTIITALSFTQVLVGSADNVNDEPVPNKVWTYDGNIEFLKGKHVILFTVALLLLLFLFLPYTLLLTFGQYVRSMSARRRCVLCLIRSTAFISIMDAYHAPYNKRHRYWTGFLLITRCVLFLAFASSNKDNTVLVNMYITNVVIIGILSIKTRATNMHKNLYFDILELCFLLNLVILCATLCYLLSDGKTSGSIICKTTSCSFSISFIIFIGILLYHAHLQLQKISYYATIGHFFLNKWPIRRQHTAMEEDTTALTHTDVNKRLPTTTLVELREELLASDENKRYNKH